MLNQERVSTLEEIIRHVKDIKIGTYEKVYHRNLGLVRERQARKTLALSLLQNALYSVLHNAGYIVGMAAVVMIWRDDKPLDIGCVISSLSILYFAYVCVNSKLN